jgi:uncharacterized protein YlxW (UPF0749 family)
MHRRPAQLSLALVCFLLGVMLVVQFRTHSRIVRDTLTLPVNEQTTIIGNLYESNQNLRQEVAELERQLTDYESSLGRSELDRMVADINRLRTVNGGSEVSGPGVEVTVEGILRGDGSLAPEDAADLVNELRDAGAEAIAVNGVRLTVNSSFTKAEGGIVINGDRIVKAPFVFQAIGQADALERALNRQGGLVAWLRGTYPSAQITVYVKTKLVLPKSEHTVALQLAQPAQ